MSTLTSVTRTAWAQPAGALPPTSGGGAHREPANAGGGCGHEGVPRGGAARAGRTQHCGWITPEELTYSEAKRPEARQTKSPGACLFVSAVHSSRVSWNVVKGAKWCERVRISLAG